MPKHPKALREALESVLACPSCKGTLACEDDAICVRCKCCQRAYPIRDGIPIFLQDKSLAQEEERQFRDGLANENVHRDCRTLLEIVARHHGVPVMRRRAEEFRAIFKSHEWLLDIGIGYGWHWAEQEKGAKILGIDISMGNLRLARRILENNGEHVVLVCADAAALPIRDRALSGVWSVQTFQHFPQEVLHAAQSELNRVLRDEFVMELYNLNPAWLYRVIYRLFGKRLHCRGLHDKMVLNRFSAEEWIEAWRQFRSGSQQISYGYSELFFHPDFRFCPRRYPVTLEQALVIHTPRLAALFARQVHLRIEAQ